MDRAELYRFVINIGLLALGAGFGMLVGFAAGCRHTEDQMPIDGEPGPVRRARKRAEARASIRRNKDDEIFDDDVLTESGYGILNEQVLQEKQ